MNPHDPLENPGAHLVFDRLGSNDPLDLSAGHPHESPTAQLARMVATAARDVDRIHLSLTERARLVIDRLEPIARGGHVALQGLKGTAQSTVFQVELLADQRGTAYQQLTRAISAFEECTQADRLPVAPQRKQGRGSAPDKGTKPPAAKAARHDAPARQDPEDVEREALQDIKHGDLGLRESPEEQRRARAALHRSTAAAPRTAPVPSAAPVAEPAPATRAR